MKKLISCLLVVAMLFTAAGAFAESSGMGRFGQSNALTKFLKETDPQTKDIALQIQSGDDVTDLVIRNDGDNLHLVTRNNNVEDGHVQFNATGLYLNGEGKVTLLRYATVTTVLQQIIDEVSAALEEAADSIPEDALPTNEEVKQAVDELAIMAYAEEAQEQADAATLSSAAAAFAGKFKPEYILDVKEEQGSVAISLRSEAFATALAEAMDELLTDPALAELVDRYAEQTGGKGFAQYQKEWAKNREATLEAIRTIQTTGMIEENGHLVSHFQIGEEFSAVKILECNTDAWINAEKGEAEATVNLGFKNEDPFLVYEFAMNPEYYHEKLSSGNSMTDVQVYFEDNQFSSGNVVTVIEGKEWLRAGAGPNFFFIKGQNGGISTSVRETWTGKTRYELVAENDKGEEASVILDFYEDGDSLICELGSSESDETVQFKLSRIDKISIEDLSASDKIDEITVEQIDAVLEGLVKLAIPAAEAGK